MLREQFVLPDCKAYLCGHSLGPMPESAADSVNQAVDDFSRFGVSGWNQSQWIELPFVLAEKIASLVGAYADELLVADSTVLNLYKCLKSAIRLQPRRRVILTTEDNFPADLYIAQGIQTFDDIELRTIKTETLEEHLTEDVAVLMLSHVNYRDASLLDMKKINSLAHQHGIITVWDLSHSVGIVPLDLNACETDFAVGCTYKYLSGGPGSPAFIYANRKYHSRLKSPVQGWLGHQQPFSFKAQYQSEGTRQFSGGTPPILSMKGLEAALELFDVDLVQSLHATVLKRGSDLIRSLREMDLQVYSPEERGGHVAMVSADGYGISRALINSGFICDYRAPDLVRICINPLYLSEQDMQSFVNELNIIIDQELYKSAGAQEVSVP